MNYKQYAENVVSGKIVAGELMKLASERFLSDLKRDDLFFNEKKVNHLIQFASVLKHYTGSHNGQPFILEPWQEFIAANIFGFYYKGSGKRRFTQSYIEVSRKNGKTFTAALFCLFAMIADGEAGAEVLLAANSKEQAKISFEMCQALVRQLDSTEKIIKPYRNEIKFFKTNSKMKVLSSDDSKLDGYNCSFGLIDEYHSAPNSKVRDVIKSSQGMRKNPHLCTITTAGFNKSYPCYKLREYAIEVLHNVKHDDSLFAAIYSMDIDDDWTDENNWIKCTPNLDVTVSKEFLKSQVQQAINNPSDEVGVKTKNLNLWCDTEQIWIPSIRILPQIQKIDLDDFVNREDYQTYVGVDLAATSDLTALSFLVTNGDNYFVKNYYFVPQTALTDKSNKELYKEWSSHNHLIVTPGNVTDYDYLTNFLMEYQEKLHIQSIGYDKWNATQWAIKCTELGLPLIEYPQNIGSFNAPTKELERLILNGTLFIDKNPINRFCFDNVVLKSDWNGNVKPNKNTNDKKIDGVIAMIEALGVYLRVPHYSNEILTI